MLWLIFSAFFTRHSNESLTNFYDIGVFRKRFIPIPFHSKAHVLLYDVTLQMQVWILMAFRKRGKKKYL